MRRLLSATLVCLCAATMPGFVQAENAAAAKTKYESGVQHFDLAEYEAALADFKEAYRQKSVPIFLYNIAQCHRKLGHTDEAITFYQTYLRREPEAKNRDDIERRIAELQATRAGETTSAAPGGKAPPAVPAVEPKAPAAIGTAASPPAPAVQPIPMAVTPADGPPTATPAPSAALDFSSREAAAPEAGGTVFSRWWFWTAVGVVVAGAVTTGIIMAERDPTKVPSTDLGSQKVLP